MYKKKSLEDTEGGGGYHLTDIIVDNFIQINWLSVDFSMEAVLGRASHHQL